MPKTKSIKVIVYQKVYAFYDPVVYDITVDLEDDGRTIIPGEIEYQLSKLINISNVRSYKIMTPDIYNINTTY